MIEQIMIAQCDICGVTQKAKPKPGQYNETEYTVPDGWVRSETNDKFCICAQCAKKLNLL